MHEVVRNELERHLSGKASAAFYAHVAECDACRTEVAEMDEISLVLRELSPTLGEVPEPSLGFYTRVAATIREQQPRSPFARLFSPGQAFFQRIAFASLVLMAGLGTVLINNEANEDGLDATTIMAQYDGTTSHASAAEPERLLVTLAAYHE